MSVRSNRYRSLKSGAPEFVLRQREMAAENKRWPRKLHRVHPVEWPKAKPPLPPGLDVGERVMVWRSSSYIVHEFLAGPWSLLVINHAAIDVDSQFTSIAALSIVELHRLKEEAGHDTAWAMEILQPGLEPLSLRHRYLWIIAGAPPNWRPEQ